MNVRAQLLLALCLAMLFAPGCREPEVPRLLVAYSGDCQGYLEPCG